MTCKKCDGYGWVWWDELDKYHGPAIETGQDDTKYTCDACGGMQEKSSAQPAGYPATDLKKEAVKASQLPAPFGPVLAQIFLEIDEQKKQLDETIKQLKKIEAG